MFVVDYVSYAKRRIQEALKTWMGVMTIPVIVIILLAAAGVPQKISRGYQSQAAIKDFYEIENRLIKAKAMILRLDMDMDGDDSDIRYKLKKIYSSTESSLLQYKIIIDSDNLLFNKISELIAAYKSWFNAEKLYLDNYQGQYEQGFDAEKHQYGSPARLDNNALFLNMLRLLSSSEVLINKNIDSGMTAMYVLQWSGVLIVIYFIFVIAYLKSIKTKYLNKTQSVEAILSSIGDAVIVTDAYGKITVMNPEAERLTGWSYERAKNRNLSTVFKVINESGREPQADIVEKVKRDKRNIVYADDAVLLASNGNRYQIYESGAPMFDDNGVIVGIVLVFRDITHEHKLQEQVLTNSRRTQRVIDSSMDAVIVINEDDTIAEWNPAASQIFGWEKREVFGKLLHKIIIPEGLREQHLHGIDRLIKNGDKSVLAKRIKSTALHKNGSIFPIELAMVSIYTEDGWMFNAFIRDLTEQNANEENIQKHNALLSQVQHIAKLGYWEFDLITDGLKWSDEVYRIFCIDPETVECSYDLFINSVHPDDRSRVDYEYSQSLKSRKPYSVIHRIVTSEGVKVVYEQCDTIYENDQPVRSLGVVQDITEQTNDMNELRLAATMFKTHAGILITEKDGTIIRVNPAFERMTGYTSSELIGENPRILQSGKQSDEFYRDLWHNISINGVWQGELWNRRKDGSLYAEWLTITEVRDDNGEIINYVGTTQDITERKEAEFRINYLAYHDDLTDLANRRLLRVRLRESVKLCKQEHTYGAVLVLDLDRFKDLNDSLGHLAGDEVLCQIASRLKSIIRNKDTVARMGGDEFVIVLSSLDTDLVETRKKAQSMANNIHQVLSEPYKLKNVKCYSNVSIGIALFPEYRDDIDDILKHADTALYRAKDHKHDATCFYTSSMQVEVDTRLAIADGLREAVNNNEFMLHYQPQVNNEGTIIGAEALLRWKHPERGIISPDEFISVAESTGIILEIGAWVIQEAAAQLARWHTNGNCKQGEFRLAVNVSTRQFRQQYFVEHVLDILNKADVPPECIELEITESLLMDDLGEVVYKMMALRAHGIRISIDDFGTGYSSLSYLTQLPIDQLKIDKSFIRDLASDNNDVVVVETIISMANHLGLNVIAEGVESSEQLQLLNGMGCNLYQGHYFSRPISADEFSIFISRGIQTSN